MTLLSYTAQTLVNCGSNSTTVELEHVENKTDLRHDLKETGHLLEEV